MQLYEVCKNELKSNDNETLVDVDSSSLSNLFRENISSKSDTQFGSITAVDVFSGAGGFSQAAYNVGINVLAAVENSRHSCATYRRNLIERLGLGIRLFEKNINELTPEEMIASVPALVDGCDLLMGGPPCQGFSSHRFKDKGVGDPRNELLIRYFHFVSTLRPKVFLVENVPGLLWERHKKYLKRFKRKAKLAGYRVFDPVVLNACDYGVPQRRRRVFILGTRLDINPDISWPPETTHRKPGKVGKADRDKPEWIKAADVFRHPIPPNDSNAICMNHSPELIERFRNTPKNGGSRSESGHVLPCHKNYDGHKDCYGRIDPSKPGPTMTTACINPSKGRFVHPTQHHGISLRHAARFQTFPDEFMFEGGLTAGGVQIGNAVPIIMGEVLLSSIVEALKSQKDKKDG